jgi:hypothetical protein
MPSIFQAQALRLLLKRYTVDFFLSYLVLSRFLQAVRYTEKQSIERFPAWLQHLLSKLSTKQLLA